MRIPWQRKGTVLTGAVCTIQVTVNTATMDSDSEAVVWNELTHKSYEHLRSEMLATTHQVLGQNFNIRSISFTRSSIEIFITIGTIGAIYMGVSRYKNFVESINLLVSQLDRVVRHFLEVRHRGPLSTFATGEPSAGVLPLEAEDARHELWAYWLLLYVIVTHGVLLGFLIWLLVWRIV